MNKTHLILRWILLIVIGNLPICLLGQDDHDIQTIDNEYYKQVNPEAWRFHQYSFSQVNHNNGKANIEVPIYQINAGRISVPIKLVYNTQGIKVENTSSVVGTGWDLIAGGRITRRIMGGMMDLQEFDQINNSVGQSSDNEGNIDEIDIDLARVENRGYQKRNNNVEFSSDDNIDQAPDMFSCSAPGLYAEFFYSSAGNVNVLNSRNIIVDETIVEDMPFKFYINNTLINQPHDEYVSFCLMNEEGLRYTFSKYEVGSTSSSNWTVTDNIGSWVLSEIYDPLSGENVSFEYEEVSLVLNYSQDNVVNKNTSGCGCNSSKSLSTTSTTSKVKRVSKISWNNGYLKFNYESNRLDCKYDYDLALRTIKLYGSDHKLKKDLCLKQSYFESIGGTDYRYKRLKLDKIEEYSIGNQDTLVHEFAYYTGNLPHRASKEQDLWGYYNDNNATSLLPKLYFYPEMAPAFSKNIVSNCFFPERLLKSSNKYYIIDGANRAVNSAALKIGMLKEIKLPTGGLKTLEYEPNIIAFDLDELKGGGLRVSKEKLVDEESSYEKIYEYASGKALALPQMAHMCDANSFSIANELQRPELIKDNLIVYSYSFLSSMDLNPYEVLYSYVTEKQEGNGELRYDFHPVANDYSLVKWKIEQYGNIDYTCSFLNSSYSNKHFTLPPRTALSGKVNYKRYFEEGNSDMVKFVQLNYKLVNEVLMSEDLKAQIGYMDLAFYYNDIDYSYSIALKSEEIIEYYKREGLSERKTYSYDDRTDLLIGVTNHLENTAEVVTLKYPTDLVYDQAFQGNTSPNFLIFEKMERMNINIPIYSSRLYSDNEKRISYLKDFTLNLFKIDGENIRLNKSYSANFKGTKSPYNLSFGEFSGLNALSSSMFELNREILKYSYTKPSLIYNHKTGVSTLLAWNPDDLSRPYLVAQNAGEHDVHYESYELKGSYPGLQHRGTRVNSALFGDYCLQPLAGGDWVYWPSLLDNNKEYWLSFWATGNGTAIINDITNSNSKSINISSNTWKYYITKIKDLNEFTLGFDMQGVVDEIRIFPVGSKMLTRTQVPLVGVTSETDQNGISTIYKYDDFNRLKSIKDIDGNILKHFEYNYANGATPKDPSLPTLATYISVSKSRISFPSISEIPELIHVSCDGVWGVNKPSWILMSKPSGSGSYDAIEITATPNRQTTSRSGVITFSIPGKTVRILVSQSGESSGGGKDGPIKEDFIPEY